MMEENEHLKRLEEIERDEQIKTIRKKIASGKADYGDAYKFAWQVGELTAEVAKKVYNSAVTGETKATEAVKALRTLLENNYSLIADATAEIQKELNKKVGIGLNAVKPEFNKSRTEGLIKWLFDSDNPTTDVTTRFVEYSSEIVGDSAKEYSKSRKAAEAVKNKEAALSSKIENYSGSVVTDSVKENAKFQSESGLRPYVTRTVVGECCEWCSELAGRYLYTGRLKDVFRRHDNCRCLVLYDAGDGKKTDVWTKIDYKDEKDARVAKEKEIEAAKLNEDKHTKQKNIARDKGDKHIDATEYWQNKPKEYPAKLISLDKELDYNGEHYSVDGHHVKFKPSPDEISTAKWWVERYGGTVELLPKVEYPLGVATPDYLINGEKVDSKGLTGSGNNLIDNAVKSRRKQADMFIVDVTNAGISDKEIRAQASKVMSNERRMWIRGLFIVKEGEIFQVLERT